MTVQELMARVDTNRVVDAYLLLDYYFSRENFEQSIKEKYEAIHRLRYAIDKNTKLIMNCTLKKNVTPHTIFILEVNSDDYDEAWKKFVDGFAICDNDVIPVLEKNFHLFDNDGKNRVEHYSFDMTAIDELAEYSVSDASICEYGNEICAAYILSNIFRFGFIPEERENNIKKICNQLNESIKNLENGEIVPFENLEEMLESKYFVNTTEEDKIYREAKKTFDKTTEKIRRNHIEKIIKERHQQYIDAIKTEYLTRRKG